ncbi:putative periplasmic binding proteins and sugar binding domain of the LacI family [Fimbriimonas ginsengisoli Gsoil 348]|uniref:Putative periplasmic binding proteins and sugar binding domain of the LacI family n=1 Tax=Fimbriimonas ginsengisoli Gsoil 348 TaxID=661478 RepID=A0A068NQD1_FIMGI|nr:putative periplasmic binding proteins and sugar binding domain of the LacI family [Fimbriimonas ginsengisoli Gsoil 348]
MPTEAQLIAEFGASKMTVHRALQELSSSGLITRVERVGTFVAKLEAPTPERGKIGLFLPTNEGFLEIKLLAGIREAAGDDRQLVLYATDNDPVLEAEMLTKAVGEVDGILILPTGHPRVSRRLEEINESVCPVVCLDREPTSAKLPSVATGNYEAAKAGMEYLTGAGHRRIAYFGLFAMEMSSLSDRYRAYHDVMTGIGVEDPTSLSRFIEARDSADFFVELRLFEDALFRLTSGPEPITAAFCVNEHYLGVLLEVCHLLPPDVRERFEIVSFCDWPSLSFPSVRTHLIRQDARAVGRLAAAKLCRAMAGEKLPLTRDEIPASFEPVPFDPNPFEPSRRAFLFDPGAGGVEL